MKLSSLRRLLLQDCLEGSSLYSSWPREFNSALLCPKLNILSLIEWCLILLFDEIPPPGSGSKVISNWLQPMSLVKLWEWGWGDLTVLACCRDGTTTEPPETAAVDLDKGSKLEKLWWLLICTAVSAYLSCISDMQAAEDLIAAVFLFRLWQKLKSVHISTRTIRHPANTPPSIKYLTT